MKNEQGGEVNGYIWRRARLCDQFPGLRSEGWRWFLFQADGKYLRNFATRRQMEWFARNRAKRASATNAAEFERS